jgi:ribose-phosphate pyrophosphokinase
MTFSLYELRKRQSGSIVILAPHKVFYFPGGEAMIDWQNPTASIQIAYLQGCSGDDLFALSMWNDAVKGHGHNLKTVLVLPYLPGARADRGTPLGAKVYADFINSLDLDKVICLDPHSDVARSLYNNLHVVEAADLPIWTTRLQGRFDGVIIPDKGAHARASAVAWRLGVPRFQASKERDFTTGKLSNFSIEDVGNAKHLLVVDDICDGGGTFLGLASAVPDDVQLSLWVTHGIFSNGAVWKLRERYTEVYNTESHPGYINNPNRMGTSILTFLLNHSGIGY